MYWSFKLAVVNSQDIAGDFAPRKYRTDSMSETRIVVEDSTLSNPVFCGRAGWSWWKTWAAWGGTRPARRAGWGHHVSVAGHSARRPHADVAGQPPLPAGVAPRQKPVRRRRARRHRRPLERVLFRLGSGGR